MKPQSTQRPPSEVSGIKPHNPSVKSAYIRVIRGTILNHLCCLK